MEQLNQLRDMRDAASVRLEEARAAIEASPDAKLVSSLTSLIEDLETSLGMGGADQATNQAVSEPVETNESASAPTEEAAPEPTPEVDSSEMSLEDSLEAELLGDNPAS